MKLKLFVLLSMAAIANGAADVIILMGPSCAGKSTLSFYLCEKLTTLQQDWIVVDFDEVNENIDELLLVTTDYIAHNVNVIIDTNTYKNEMEQEISGADTILKMVVTAPLDVLLARDTRRTIHLKRTENRAQICRHFVISSFNESSTWDSDMVIDTSKQSLEQASESIIKLYRDRKCNNCYVFLQLFSFVFHCMA